VCIEYKVTYKCMYLYGVKCKTYKCMYLYGVKCKTYKYMYLYGVKCMYVERSLSQSWPVV